METWKTFFRSAARPIAFDFDKIEIVAGAEVAFANAVGQCVYIPPSGESTPLQFRLTMGFREMDSHWLLFMNIIWCPQQNDCFCSGTALVVLTTPPSSSFYRKDSED